MSNGIGDIGRELTYMRENVEELRGVQLAPGTVAFNANRLPLTVFP